MKPNEFRNNVLVDFNMLWDTDLGAALYLRASTKKTEYFEDHIMTANLQYFKYMALARKEENHVEYMFKDIYKGNADTLYGELLAKKWNKVLDFSPVTSICKMFLMAVRDGGYKVTVNCRNEEEVKRVKLFTNLWSAKTNVEDVKDYNFLYVHDLVELIRRRWVVEGKVVYLYDYSKNHENDDVHNEDAVHHLALRWANVATFNFISPYADYKMPVG